jgi:general transcription factor 3C polypeptide 1
MINYMKSTYYIYSYSPVDDEVIRGSCKEFKTRKRIEKSAIKSLKLSEIYQKYNQKFVIVANQITRESVLIPKNVGRDHDVNNHLFCILERIGRSRKFGEAMSGSFSLNDLVKDSKLLHYFRNALLKNQLVVRQQVQMKIRGQNVCGQLFHLPRFQVVIKASNTLLTEQLVNFLKEQPNHFAAVEAVRNLLNLKQKALLNFIKAHMEIFQYSPKFPYIEVYPNATKEQCLNKNKSEKMIPAVKLVDPTINVFDLWKNKEDETQAEDAGFLDISRQAINRPLTHQVANKIIESGKEGMSQLEIGKYFGLSKLSSRSVIRKLERQKIISFYMKDEGKQRLAK